MRWQLHRAGPCLLSRPAQQVMPMSRAWFSFTPVLSEPQLSWTGAQGFVHEAAFRLEDNWQHHEIYAAGPPPPGTSS